MPAKGGKKFGGSGSQGMKRKMEESDDDDVSSVEEFEVCNFWAWLTFVPNHYT